MQRPQSIENAQDLIAACEELYRSGDHDALSESFLRELELFRDFLLVRPPQAVRQNLAAFLNSFMSLFVRPDYSIDRVYQSRFIWLNPVISNLACLCGLGTTDRFVRLVPSGDYLKLLTLVSPRNEVDIDYDALLRDVPALANLWYSAYVLAYQAQVSDRHCLRRLQRHVRVARDPDSASRLSELNNPNFLHYAATYIDEHNDRYLKRRINEIVQDQWGQVVAPRSVTVDDRKFAVVSTNWTQQHSVYRNFSQFIGALAERFELTLITGQRLDGKPPYLGDGVFADHVSIDPGGAIVDQVLRLAETGFAGAFFADVGMSLESVMLANTRIAPVQIAGVGHSVSGFGTCVDYFISGEQVEVADRPERYYTERLALIPGFGVIHNQPLYPPSGEVRTGERFLVACPWTAQKLNADMLEVLAEIQSRANRDIMFQLLPGGGTLRLNNFSPLMGNLERALGEGNVVISPPLPYDQYMLSLEKSDINLDSYHFGGCNTIADSLHVGRPVITWEGTKWYNRIGSAMLASAGLELMVARSAGEYIDKAVRLIDDDEWRQELRKRIADADLQRSIFAGDSASWFARTVEYLVRHHHSLQQGGGSSPLLMRDVLPRAQ